MLEKDRFKNFVSLGYICPVAASMGKYGLRSFSGPFDWLITKNLEEVLRCIENEFKDFLVKENLEYFVKSDFKNFIAKENLENFVENPKHFIDRSNDFVFLHEAVSFDIEYEKIYAKFSKRIKNFLIEIKKKTCFLRLVINKEEIVWIKNNFEYINSVIRRYNPTNEVVFLIKDDKYEDANDLEKFPFKFFMIKESFSGNSIEALRGWFDESVDLLQFCGDNFDSAIMMRNIIFEKKKESLESNRYYAIKQRYDMLLKILQTNFENVLLPSKILIYGAGNIGKQFYMSIKGRCEVVAFLETSIKDTIFIDDIPVIDLKGIKIKKDVPIVITPTYDFENICDCIKEYNENATIISLDNILT